MDTEAENLKTSLRPIFIIGAPRSGTSVFYRKFAHHPECASITRSVKKVPHLLLLSRILMFFRTNHAPTEANRVWKKFIHQDNEFLSAADLTPKAERYYRKVIINCKKLYEKPRFLNKCPGNSLRIEYLNQIFPSAIFIHIVRDGRAAAYSIMKSRKKHGGKYWGVKPPGWRKLKDMPLLEASAMQWKLIVDQIDKSLKKIPPQRRLQIRYEEMAGDPVSIFNKVCTNSSLAPDAEFIKRYACGIENRNYKWKENLSLEQQSKLNKLIGNTLKKFSYQAG